jgi:hypothetical protein
MSITTWTRLEPDTQTGHPSLDLNEGVAARLADPLWLLGRQWQMGELSGEDAASPVAARITSSSFAIDSLQTPAGSLPFSAASVAAEAEIEHDRGAPDRRTRASGGVSFVERLAEGGLSRTYRTAVLQNYPLDPGVPDGDLLLVDLKAGSLKTKVGVTAADAPAFDKIARAWAAWYRPRSRRGANPAWVADRLEYRFSAGVTVTEGRLTLTAPEHTGDRLDWDAFSAGAPAEGTSAAPRTTSVDVAPALLQIPGMPALTFWEIEDPRFDPGSIEAAPTDTARLLLVEAALAYSADWFLLPLRLPVASLNRIDSLLVTDTFGVTTLIRPADQIRPHPGWHLWRVSDLPYLLLPPPATGFLAADPVEQIALVRDEAANLAWALRVVPRSALPGPQETVSGSGDLTYLPITTPPDDRVPMPLMESDEGRWLVRGRLAGQQTDPVSELLNKGFRLRDEELPDEGLTLERRYELGRTPDGVLHLWVSRVKRTGARLPLSGLTFDRILEVT